MPKFERIKRRHLLKKTEHRDELERIRDILGSQVGNLGDERFEEGILDDDSRVLLLDGEIVFWEEEGTLYPTLRALLSGIVDLPEITVDMGAVKFVANGADIMAPGVVEIDDVVKDGQVVAIVDERHGKPLAVGVATMDAEDMRNTDSGKVVLSRHHVNDELWQFGKNR
ncbi:MAG: RNA-binding protein [Candidatus Thorarchaeota archaeon]|nr:RNA-binding protein [Candidatus Thorarchaeota archaeon]